MAEENEKQREKEMEEIIAFVRIKASVNGRIKKNAEFVENKPDKSNKKK